MAATIGTETTVSDLSNKAQEVTGKAKEKLGSLTGDEELKGEGQADQAESKVRQAAEDLKGAAHDVADRVKGVLKRDN
ncbi:CsbD family protein [Kitasatospora sp. MMS16-BH015]|uniref:CsbD family protein n=1 Tax=Kitasatospora sp. MMS16-BH015 TaxID=2018025 RepID=UPI000CA3B59E|nr:CsbD family protein [Kitasatospora sp. MMS16-BH015]AUG75687.1 CsbD family protein [Kitasatospora sp. MMS16-BH015]